jgi:hypothetical protein
MSMSRCIFCNRKCRAVEIKEIADIKSSNILEFIHKICTVCIKKQYANAKEAIAKKRYVVVNTL